MSVAVGADDRRFLWGLSYRLTGSAADADDIVQETMVRVLERPPPNLEEPLRPWLVRVALNLGRDVLRKRKRTAYVGPWLPSPVDDDALEIAAEPASTEGRYDLLESVSFAFLLALEALTPRQRAVLLLCDVFDYSVRDAAAALGISESNVKTTHHRARAALAAYDAQRVIPLRDAADRARDALGRFLASIGAGDSASAESILSAEVRALSDGGGEFFAARVPITGKRLVAKLYIGLRKHQRPDARFVLRSMNGMPALVVEQGRHHKQAPRFVLSCDVDAEGRITAIYSVLATPKLRHVAALG